MKLLKIEGGKAEYYDGKNYISISEIDAAGFKKLIDNVYNNDFSGDDYSLNEIPNLAERLIYTKIYEKLKVFNDQKSSLKDEIDQFVKPIKEKYKIKI